MKTKVRTAHGTRTTTCTACGEPGARWSPALRLALCPPCTTAGTGIREPEAPATGVPGRFGAPERDPVLLGDLLPVMAATLRDAATRAAAVPVQREGDATTCGQCGAHAEGPPPHS